MGCVVGRTLSVPVCMCMRVYIGVAITGASSRCEAEYCKSSTGLCCHLGLSRSSSLSASRQRRRSAPAL